MDERLFSEQQREVICADLSARIHLSGKAGCGKSAAGAERARFLLENAEGWPQDLIFTPGRNYNRPYEDLLSSDGIRPTVTSYNSYVQNCLKLFWPLIAGETEFGRFHAAL